MKEYKKLLAVIALTLTCFTMVSCSAGSSGASDTTESVEEESSSRVAEKSSEVSMESEVVSEESESSTSTEKAKAQEPEADVEDIPEVTEQELAGIPEYSGTTYTEVNDNEPFFDEEDLTTEEFEEYSELDSLGRCGTAFANISEYTQPTEERGEIGMIRPSGWHTANYGELVEGNYLYNRCHLIAFCLAGENANERNLITGTRYMNAEGMLPFEEKVNDYVDRTGNHVFYRVTPDFEGDNLVASGVLMEAESVEDEGAGICFCVYCYNVQPQIEIDYATGESARVETVETPKEASQQEESQQETATENSSITYVINTNTGVFHYADCNSVNQMKEKNKAYSSESRDTLISEGYRPCGNCHP